MRGGMAAPAAADPPPLVEELAREGWLIGTAERKVRAGGRFQARMQSGIDWFDLEGALDFEGLEAHLPELLEAARRGHGWVNLADGTLGLLPPGWLARWSALIKISQQRKGLRFGRGQALILHSLLQDNGEIEIDEVFTRIRDKLRTFDRLEMADAPPGFEGELRLYQRLGVAWLDLLAELQLGGCPGRRHGSRQNRAGAGLAAAAQAARPAARPAGLSCWWCRKAWFSIGRPSERRFTPGLSFAILHGSGRATVRQQIHDHDLAITTYGTLVRDVDKLREIEFDVVVLDEAQAIKNRNTQAAEACNALRAGQRLALTGTPVENHLGELWSIFDFLNPGLLGSLPKISKYAGRLRLAPEALAEVARALRPLILRRKKADVLADLPAKTEQTLVCELAPKERKRYDELRTFYQASLKKKIAEVGLPKARSSCSKPCCDCARRPATPA